MSQIIKENDYNNDDLKLQVDILNSYNLATQREKKIMYKYFYSFLRDNSTRANEKIKKR